jgi:zinc protease
LNRGHNEARLYGPGALNRSASPDGGKSTAARFAPERFVLPNGLVVLSQPNPTSPAISISLRVAAGACLETPETTGLANFCGGMLKRGTTRRSKQEIGEVLDFTGSHLGSSAGRHTAGIGAKSRSADFEQMMELVAECALTPSFPTAEVERMRGNLLTAIREDEDDTRQVAMDGLRQLVYAPEHPYSWHLIGTEETTGRHHRDDLVAFHARYFRPNASALVVVGAVDPDQVRMAAERYFSSWPADTDEGPGQASGVIAALPEIPDASPPPRTVREVSIMPGKVQADIALGHPGLRRADADYYAVAIMNMILGRFAMGGRLGHSVREEQGMAYYTFSTFDASFGPGPFVVRAGVHPDNVEAAIDSIIVELQRISTETVSEKELDDATSALVRSLPRALETNEGLASTLHTIEQFDLGLDYLQKYPGLIGEITVDDVLAAARDHIHLGHFGVSIAGP